jgi:hypothetical protein
MVLGTHPGAGNTPLPKPRRTRPHAARRRVPGHAVIRLWGGLHPNKTTDATAKSHGAGPVRAEGLAALSGRRGFPVVNSRKRFHAVSAVASEE